MFTVSISGDSDRKLTAVLIIPPGSIVAGDVVTAGAGTGANTPATLVVALAGGMATVTASLDTTTAAAAAFDSLPAALLPTTGSEMPLPPLRSVPPAEELDVSDPQGDTSVDRFNRISLLPVCDVADVTAAVFTVSADRGCRQTRFFCGIPEPMGVVWLPSLRVEGF